MLAVAGVTADNGVTPPPSPAILAPIASYTTHIPSKYRPHTVPIRAVYGWYNGGVGRDRNREGHDEGGWAVLFIVPMGGAHPENSKSPPEISFMIFIFFSAAKSFRIGSV